MVLFKTKILKTLNVSFKPKLVDIILTEKNAKLFGRKIKFLPRREGERYASALTNMNLSNKVYKHFGKIDLRDYIREFIENNQ